MLDAVWQLFKRRKYVFAGFFYAIMFAFIYFLLDHLNGGYAAMATAYGWILVGVNVFLNVVMTSMSALMMILSTAYLSLSGKEGKGTFFGNIAVFFGMLTYGCTSCVVSFFAAIGITLSVAVLPFAGLPYKLIAFVILIGGFLWLLLEIKAGKCKKRPVKDVGTPIEQ
ncbi:MAG: hypothetical protein V1761_04395 [bacterium]